MISICDTEVKDGKIVVVNQRDFKVPKFRDEDINQLCINTSMNHGCEWDCRNCVISRITE